MPQGIKDVSRPPCPATASPGGPQAATAGTAQSQNTGDASPAPSPLRSTIWRLRRQWAPHAVTLATLTGGLIVHAASAADGHPSTVAAVTAVAMYGTVGVTMWLVWVRTRPRWRHRLLLAGLTVASWLTVAAWGVGAETLVLLLAAEYALAARWWQAHRIGHTRDALLAGEDLTATQVEWAEYVACDGGPLPGSRLVDPDPFAYGEAYTLLLKRGSRTQTFMTAASAVPQIAGALDADITDVIVERHPTSRSLARARFVRLHTRPLDDNPVFDGPRLRGGAVALGPYADGHGEALYTLYSEDSMWSGVLIGATGIGKSRVVDNAAISVMARGDTVIVYIDPKEGGSSPALFTHAHWSGGLSVAGTVLDALLALIEVRNKENYAVYGDAGFTPGRARPGILVVIDECHRVFATRQADWAHVARSGRSAGLALLAVSQYAGLATFGNNEALRSSIMMGNTLAMYAPSRTNGQLMAGLEVDPMTLPNIPGYGYTQASERLGGRTAPWRNRLVDTQAAPAWMETQPETVPDPVTETTIAWAAGAVYTNRHATAADAVSSDRAFIDALRSGDTSALSDDTRSRSTRTAAREPDPERAARVVTFPSAPFPANETDQLSRSHRAVLDAVVCGASRPVEVEDATGLGQRRIAAILRELTEAGHLAQPRYGRYVIADTRKDAKT